MPQEELLNTTMPRITSKIPMTTHNIRNDLVFILHPSFLLYQIFQGDSSLLIFYYNRFVKLYTIQIALPVKNPALSSFFVKRTGIR